MFLAYIEQNSWLSLRNVFSFVTKVLISHNTLISLEKFDVIALYHFIGNLHK